MLQAIETELQEIEARFAHPAEKDCLCDTRVEFQDAEISLDIKKGGEILDSGWKITPMAHPGVSWSCNLVHI